MSEGALVLFTIDCALNGAADTGIDIDNKGFIFIAKEDGATVGSGHNAFDADLADFIFHFEKFGSYWIFG